MAANFYESMVEHLKKAVEAREDVFQADREAIADLRRQIHPRSSSLLEETAAKQRARGMAQVKEAIENNRWYMMQAVAFGVASIARSLVIIQKDVRDIREAVKKR